MTHSTRFVLLMIVSPLIAASLACGGGGAAGPAPGVSGAGSPPTVMAWRWRQMTAAAGLAPEGRSHGSAIYDPMERRLIVFGGENGSDIYNDVWAFDLAAPGWRRLATVGTPPEPRLGADAVYDPNQRQMVIWAGQQGNRFFNDTWTLDLRTLTWRDVSPSTRPQARYGSASVFDPVERRLVQFAGFTSLFRRFRDTQGFDLDTLAWEDLNPPADGPAIRCLHTAALHGPSRRMIVYGGQQSGPLDDLWAFDLATRSWRELTPAGRPAGRMLASSFVDRDGRFLVFGGSTTAGPVNETWAFNLGTGEWARQDVPDPPPARAAAQAAYAEDDERFIVFGGLGSTGRLTDVWELRRVAVPAAP